MNKRMCLLGENMGASEWTGHSKPVNILFSSEKENSNVSMCFSFHLFSSFPVFFGGGLGDWQFSVFQGVFLMDFFYKVRIRCVVRMRVLS